MDDSAKLGHVVDTDISVKDAPGPPEQLKRSEIQSLCDVIHDKVIPELCRIPNADEPAGQSGAFEMSGIVSPAEYHDLSNAVIGGRTKEATELLGKIIDDGVEVERIYLDLLAPLARNLGEKWEQDELDFLSITAALGILQTLLHSADRRAPLVSANPEPHKVIALARVPGDQHVFGILTVARFFERAGWQVIGGPDREYNDDFIHTTAETSCAVAGLSVGSEAKVPMAASVIAKLRAACQAADLTIVVGGPAIGRNPSLAGALGADAMAEDAQRAVTVAESFV